MPDQNLVKALERGVGFHRSGRLSEAAGAYREVLALDRGNFDALNLLGLVEHAQGRFDAALGCFERAVASSPRSAAAHFNKANTLGALGRGADAVGAYRKALALQPEYADAWLNLGASLHQQGDLAGAIAAFKEMTLKHPRDVRGHYNVGRCLAQDAQTDLAEAALSEALRLAPTSTDALITLAKLYADTKRTPDAITTIQKALALDPKNAEWLSTMATWLTQAERHDEAIELHRRACALSPERAELHYNLGNALYAARDLNAAASAFRAAIERAPDFAAAYNNLGEVLRDTGEFNAALEVFEKALHQKNENQKGSVRATALINKSLALLAMGRLDEGWSAYRGRFDIGATHEDARAFPYPFWNGQELADKKILIWAEQGVGDQLLYGSMLNDIAVRAARCIFECDVRLVSLFQRSFPALQIVPRSDPQHPEIERLAPDFQSALADLGGFCRSRSDSFPPQPQVLAHDPIMAQAFRRRYLDHARGRPIIGISWESHAPRTGKFKSIPLSAWCPILENRDAVFVSLQYADQRSQIEDQIEEIRQKFSSDILVDDRVDAVKDLDAFAAQIAAVDLVISISNTTVHVAGSLGRETWTLLPRGPGALWYWFLDREDCPWYPSVRLFRQSEMGEWSDVISRVSAQLDAWLQSRAPA